MKFFEPEEKFEIEKIKKKNLKTKIGIFFTIIMFGIIPTVLVKSNVVNLFKNNKISIACIEDNTYNRNDDEELKLLKAKKSLGDHLATLKELDGFIEIKIELINSVGTQRVPSFKIFMRQDSKDIQRMPEEICGFKTIISLE